MKGLVYILLDKEDSENYIIYSLKNLCFFLGYRFKIISTEDLNILSLPNKDSIYIYFGRNVNAFRWCDLVVPIQDYSKWLTNCPLVTFIEGIAVLYVGEKPESLIKGNILGFDLVNIVFYLLSRQEEYLISERDQWGRFLPGKSCLYKYGIINKPIIDYYIKYIRQFLHGLAKNKDLRLETLDIWKGGKQFAVALTHDVDFLNLHNLRYGVRLIKTSLNSKFNGFLGGTHHILGELGRRLLGRRDPLWNLDQLMSLENNFGIRSTYFFSCHVNKPHIDDPSYEMEDKILFQNKKLKINQIIKLMELKGWEVGLHGSINSLYQDGLLRKEKESLVQILGRDKVGNRQHFLRLDPVTSWARLEQAGLFYDSSLGYLDEVGYRLGTGYPFYPYNLRSGRPLELLEFPLVFIEGTLETQDDMDEKKAFNICMHYIKEAEATSGMLNLLWHTHTICQKRCRVDWGLVYQKVLNELNTKDVWIAPLGEIAQWWTNKVQMLESNNDG